MTEEKGFVIRDRRFSSQEEGGQAPVPPPEAKAGGSGEAGPGPVEEKDAQKAADRADAAASVGARINRNFYLFNIFQRKVIFLK